MRARAATREELSWLTERVGVVLSPSARGIAAADARGAIRGMVGFDGWTSNSVQVHIALDTPVAWRALLRPTFQYAFEEAGRGLLLAIIPAWNERSADLTSHVGFREAHRIRDGWDVGVDLLVFEMRKDECRFLGGHRKAA